MDIYDLFGKFELELLSNEWVTNQWKSDFSEDVEFPVEFEDYLERTNLEELFKTTSLFIKDWLMSDNPFNNTCTEINRASTSRTLNSSNLNTTSLEHPTKSWQNLISNSVQHKALVSVLSVFIIRGKTEKKFQVKRLGLIATDLYLVLLAIPGSQVYHIFNPILFSHAIENLKICNVLNSCIPKAKPASKKRRAQEDDFDEEENLDEDDTLIPSDKTELIKLLGDVFNGLLFTLKKFNLKGQDDSLLITIQILILVTRVERSSTSLFSRSPLRNSPTYLAFKAYRLLLELCSPDHGDVQETVRIIMREMMPGLIIYKPEELKVLPKEILVIKDHSILFIKNLLSSIKDPAFLGVCALVQCICIKIPDKADLRAKEVQVVLELLQVLPYSLYSHIVVWIMKFCYSDQVKHRTAGLEIVTKLLYANERVPTSPLKPVFQNATKAKQIPNECESDNDDVDLMLSQQPNFATHTFLLGAVFSICQDVSSSVRSKVLTILANLISSNNKSINYVMESIFVTPYLDVESIENSCLHEKGFFNFQHFLKHIKEETNPNVDPLPGAKAVINLLEVFVEDEKVFVRKSALQVLANIFLFNNKWMTKKLLQVMIDNCLDISVSVRKMLVQCLTDLLMKYPSHPELPKYWVKGVLPLLADQEIKSQEKVLEALQTTLLDNLVTYNQMKTAHHALPWILLNLIAEFNKRQLFLFACHKWTLGNFLKQSLITTIKTHIGTENNDAAWFILSSISEYLDIKDPLFVSDYFYENVLNNQQVDEYCCQLVTEVMHLSWRQLPVINQINLCDNLLRHLAQFTIPLPMISRSLDICQLITETLADSPEQGRQRIKDWASSLISRCESKLEKMIGTDCAEVVEDETRMCQYIFTLGDVEQIYPGQMKHSTWLLIQNLLIDKAHLNQDNNDNRWTGRVSASVQAVAITSLGKLCLQKEQTAKLFISLFGNLLNDTSHPEIKVNVMIALTDLCIKFTSLVEDYLPEMCICLRDKDLQVRENTLTLLIQLIQEDYLKLRCPMFFHLLTMLNDEDQLIRDMISSFIINSLLVKQKNALVQHFVESLFHYNLYLDHKTYSKGGLMEPRERAVFSLEGPGKEKERRHIYRFMLENMMDDERFKVTYRLCTDVLSDAAEGEIELSKSGITLLQDALHVLSSNEIRLSQMQSGSKDDEDDDGVQDVAEAVNNLARKTLVSQVLKKNMIENTVPIFIKLKHKLKQIKSPLVRDLMACLRELMKDYKTEINEILAADKELAAEISLDLKMLDEREEADDSADEGLGVDVLKRAVMNVVALSEVRKNLTDSAKKGSRLSTSSVASHRSNKSAVSNKSIVQSANKTPSACNGVSPSSSKVSPSSTRVSPSSTRVSPGSTRVSPGSTRVSPGSTRVSPGSSRVSPGSSKESPCSTRVSPGSSKVSYGSKKSSFKQNLVPSVETKIPSSDCSPDDSEDENIPLSQPGSSRTSVSSSASEASCPSQSKKPTRNRKKNFRI